MLHLLWLCYGIGCHIVKASLSELEDDNTEHTQPGPHWKFFSPYKWWKHKWDLSSITQGYLILRQKEGTIFSENNIHQTLEKKWRKGRTEFKRVLNFSGRMFNILTHIVEEEWKEHMWSVFFNVCFGDSLHLLLFWKPLLAIKTKKNNLVINV